MALIIEAREIGGRTFTYTYSDIGMMIRQDETGYLYEEAYDPPELHRTYTETDIPIPTDEDEPTDEAYAEAGKILMGVNE